MGDFSVFVVAVTAATWGYYPTVAIVIGPYREARRDLAEG